MEERPPSVGVNRQDGCLSRRDFLKLTGAVASTLAIGGGLASLLASCRGPAPATSIAASSTTGQVAVTALLPTTVSAQPVDLIGASLALGDIRPGDVPLLIPKGSVF